MTMHATIIMEGRLVNDPEVKTGKNGDYCTFRFVVNTKYGNQDIASFYNCTTTEYIANRMKKAGIKPMIHGFIISALVVVVALVVEMAMGLV